MGGNTRGTYHLIPNKPNYVGQVIHVSFIDEHSGFTKIVPISRKSDVAAALEQFVARFERRYGWPIKFLHSDNVEEYEGLL